MKRQNHKKGFALILAIVAMAFMVMLTLTLSLTISSKLRILSAQKQMRNARSNAILGLSAAISELQRNMGKDNAISFHSSILDQDPNTPKIDDVQTPYLVGVMPLEIENSGLLAKELQDTNLEISNDLRNGKEVENVSWLISSQRRITNPLTQRIEDLNKETVTLSEYNILDSYPDSFGGLVNQSQKNTKVKVKAGKIKIKAQNITAESGAYAWHISDESQKAKLNIHRPKNYLDINGKITDSGSPSEFNAPSDTRIPQSINVSFLEKLTELSANSFLNEYKEHTGETISKLSSLEELTLVDKSLKNWVKENKNDFTLTSVGIPVDVTQGKLKEDLYQYLYGNFGLRDSEVIVRGNKSNSDKDYTGVDFGIKNYDEFLPRFGHLKDWANLALNKKGFQNGVYPEAANISSNNPKHGISPILSRVEYMFIPVYETTSKNGLWDLDKSVEVSLAIYPRIWIWNPHNVALEKSNYKIQIYAPFIFKLFDKDIGGDPNTSPTYTAYTRWLRKKINSDGKVEEDSTYTSKVNYKVNTSGYFSDILTAKADNGAPVLNFQVKNLKLLPGECVELTRADDARTDSTGMASYRDVSISQLGGNDNLLQVGTSVSASGKNSNSSQSAIRSHKAFRIKLGKDNSELEMLATVTDSEMKTATYDAARHILKGKANLDGSYYEYYPVSQNKNQNYNSIPIYGNEAPYFHANYYIWTGNGGQIQKNNVTSRIGYELYNGNKRIFVNDMTEWQSPSTPSQITNKNRYRLGNGGKTTMPIKNVIDYDVNELANAWSSDAKVGGFRWGSRTYESMLLTEASVLEDLELSAENFNKNRIKLVFRGNYGDGSISDFFFYDFTHFGGKRADLTTGVLGFRIPEIANLSNAIFLGGNLRASSIINNNLGVENVLKRAEAQPDKNRNYSIGLKFSIPNSAVSTFNGWGGNAHSSWDGTNHGSFTWENGTKITDSLIDANDKLLTEYSNFNDGNRFGHTFFLGGEGTYSYEYHACALFDYPRTNYDIMSLGAFTHANLSFFHGQPAYAFGESYASPYLKREDIYEAGLLYDNENIDISYILNSSMWDRFYLSTLPKKINDIKAGTRLANTRHFIKSVPLEKRELTGSDDAFSKSAAYIGIDGAFNVNSTSYEAWRAVLGGMLGTIKNTLTNEKINDETQSINDNINLAMPNPGSLNPIALPADSRDMSGKYLSYKDMMVGRVITEAEIDQLAREIVAEVKRRAPFFSLADFVNRRLIEARKATDIDLSYQSLMGTLAAAIHRSMMDTNRPNHFFNDQSLDLEKENASNDKESHSQNINIVTSYAENGENIYRIKDVGEAVKTNSDEFIEQVCASVNYENSWNWRIAGSRGLLSQADLLNMLGPIITVRGDTFIIRAYGESKNQITGATSKAYCEAVVQRSSEVVNPKDDIVKPTSPFGRRFNVVSFRWLTPAEL